MFSQDMERGRRDQEQPKVEHSYSKEENLDGSATSICCLRTAKNAWKSFKVKGSTNKQYPATFLILYETYSNNALAKNYEGFLFHARNEQIENMLVSIIHEEMRKYSSQVLGRINGGNLKFTPTIDTKTNNELKMMIRSDRDHDVAHVAVSAMVDDQTDEEFWIQTSSKNYFSEKELQHPNNLLKDLPSYEVQRIEIDKLDLPTFKFKILWRKPELPRVQINLVVEVIAYDDKGKPTSSSVTYPVQFNNSDATSIRSQDEMKNRKAVRQLSLVFEEARTKLAQVDSIIDFLFPSNNSDTKDVHASLTTSQEKKGELLRYVISHEEVMPSFIEALKFTGHHQNIRLVELITICQDGDVL